MTFAENLRRYREKAGYAQAKDFANELGIKYTTYIAYEQGREPNYKILIQIAEVLHVTPNDLLGWGQPKENGLKRYEVEVRYEIRKRMTVDAENFDDAGDKVREKIWNENDNVTWVQVIDKKLLNG